MERILGIDYGTKRIGLALSDPLDGKKAQPFEVIENNQLSLQKVKSYVDELDIKKIVLGRPISIKGNETESTKNSDRFYNALVKHLDIEIILWDEQYSTVDANELLIASNVSRKKRKNVVDMIAASNILQTYLDENDV